MCICMCVERVVGQSQALGRVRGGETCAQCVCNSVPEFWPPILKHTI